MHFSSGQEVAMLARHTIDICALLLLALQAIPASAERRAYRESVAACGSQLKKQCSDVKVFGNNSLECLAKNQDNLSPKCATLANNVARQCDADAARLCPGVALGQGNVLGCLITAKRSVSSRCNAAINAAHLRQ